MFLVQSGNRFDVLDGCERISVRRFKPRDWWALAFTICAIPRLHNCAGSGAIFKLCSSCSVTKRFGQPFGILMCILPSCGTQSTNWVKRSCRNQPATSQLLHNRLMAEHDPIYLYYKTT